MVDVSQHNPIDYMVDVNQRGHMAIRRNFFVSKLKWGIMALVIALILFLIIYPLTDYGKSENIIVFRPGIYPSDSLLPTMVKPRLHGVNRNNQPYNVSADRAVQHGPKLIELVKLDADIFMQDGAWVSITSNTAMYDLNTRQINMTGEVSVFVDSGYELSTDMATAYLKTSIVKGERPVVVHGPLGVIKAKSFVIKGDAHRVAFIKDVHLRAYPKSRKKGG